MICELCPRRCRAERTESLPGGICGCETTARIARAALHFGEEPCISGTRGSGTVFFCGCSLGCVYCQNAEISRAPAGKTVSPGRLHEIFLELAARGAHNVSLVTATHYTDAVLAALRLGRPPVPIVWNSSGYERVESLRRLEGSVDIYLPDLKYSRPDTAARYSHATDYFETAKAAILEMARQTGPCVFDSDGLLRRGVLIRHLILPGRLDDTRGVIDWVRETFPNGEALFSLMAQYTPVGDLRGFPEINRTLTPAEYEAAQRYLFDSGIEAGFIQDPDSAGTDCIPAFDLTGV